MNFFVDIPQLVTRMALIVACLMVAACSNASDDYDPTIEHINLDHDLRVLILGNSYAIDGTAYLADLIEAADLNETQIGFYQGSIGGAGLQEWIDVFEKNQSMNYSRVAGRLEMNHKGTLGDVLAQEWDVVVFLHTSSKSYKWETFEGNIEKLLAIIRNGCPNPQLRVAYAMPWGHTAASTPKELEGNIACAKRLADDYGVEIIPVGVAVQNARCTSLCDESYLTRDDWHLAYGVGRYVAACTWYETLLSPLAHLTVEGNTATHPISSKEAAAAPKGAQPVDDTNRILCQQCAFYAVRDVYTVRTNIENISVYASSLSEP